MSRRARAVAFVLLALVAAGAAAAIAEGYGSSVARGYGPLRPVVVATARIRAGAIIGPEAVTGDLTVRRVPERFVPAGALVSPAEAAGLSPRAVLPVGAYVLAPQLQAPRQHASVSRGLGGDRRPVEISVSGADALLAAGPGLVGARVDVVVTTEPAGPGPGHTYVAAVDVPLLGLSPEPGGVGSGGTAVATLALGRGQALRLIQAESFARRVTLLLGA
jgi:Flp pilus assembly protein CpaB